MQLLIATTSGDIIHIEVGTITETTNSEIAVGVSLEGHGVTSIVTSTVAGSWSPTIYLASTTINTNGNQHISNIKFSGGTVGTPVAWAAIYVQARGNVSIHDCTFENFFQDGVIFNGQATMGGSGEPSTWCTGNTFYNNVVTNCARLVTDSGTWMTGALCIGAQDGILIHDNTFTETARGSGNCGYPIKMWADGYNRGIKIYDNYMYKLPSSANWWDWNFCIELWYWMGGCEIYNNYMEGSIDIDHVTTGIYSFGLKVYGNTFGYTTLPPSSGDWTNLSAGLYIEFACTSVFIYGNTFHNLESPFRFSPRSEAVGNIYIYDNIINGIGNAAGNAGCNLMNFSYSGWTMTGLYFINNTVYSGSNGGQYGLIIPSDAITNPTCKGIIYFRASGQILLN